jgi:LDH2 family malate/lactate/ureidoglycolate dehydrogenase
VAHIPAYLERQQTSLLQSSQPPEIVRETPVSASIDGKFYYGQVVAHKAMSLAIDKAAAVGIGVVGVFHSGHVGRLADYVEMAAERGMIGIATVSTGGASIPAHGGMTGVAGTNPMAFGIPGKGGNHVIFDFATAAMSRGELNRRGAKGEPIPDGVILDAAGNPTTDFAVMNARPRGILMPFGGYKGSGVHLMTEILGGILVGNGLGLAWADKGGAAINGGYFLAHRVDLFQPLDHFLDQIEEFVAHVRSSQLRPEFDTMLIPGERARDEAKRSQREGIEIDHKEWAALLRCAEELKLTDIPAPL